MSEKNSLVQNKENVEKTELENQRVNKLIDTFFRERTKRIEHPQLGKNIFMGEDDYDMYTEVLEPYDDPKVTAAFNELHPDQKKTDYPKDPNVGWKVHLNVEPFFVEKVSDYLKSNGYRHKFLHGGEIEDGKTFTVYIGSYDLAERLSQVLAKDLEQGLSEAGNNNEVELAPGVVGRFVGQQFVDEDTRFRQYGTCGYSLLDDDYRHLILSRLADKKKQNTEVLDKFQKAAEVRAYKKLQEIYGEYFFKEPK